MDYSSDSSGPDDENDKEEEVKPKGLSLPPPKRSGSGLNLPAPKNRKKAGPRTIVLEKEKVEIDNHDGKEQEAVKGPEPVKKGGIGSFLPAPKGRVATNERRTAAKENNQETNYMEAPKSRQNKVLGGGLKPTFDGEVAMSEDPPQRTVAVPVTFKEREMVPASVLARRAKYGNSVPPQRKEKETKAPNVESKSLDEEKPKPKTLPNLFSFGAASNTEPEPSESSTEYEPIMLEKEPKVMEGNTHETVDSEQKTTPSCGLQGLAADSGISIKDIEKLEGRRKLKNEPVNVVDFSVDEFYQSNEDLRQKGLLEESKRPVQAVGSGKHQLRTLVESAQQNREGLEEMFVKNRRTKSEAGSKYGF